VCGRSAFPDHLLNALSLDFRTPSSAFFEHNRSSGTVGGVPPSIVVAVMVLFSTTTVP